MVSVIPLERTRIDNDLPISPNEHRRVDEDLVRQLIRRKLRDRRLPRGRASDIWAALGEGQACDACDEPIVAKQQAVWAIATRDWISIHFHALCYELWEVERLALARQEGDGARS